jgi:hypothetical protein
MKRIVRAMPAARSVLIAGLAAANAGLSDDFPEVHCTAHGCVCPKAASGCVSASCCIPRVRAPGQTASFLAAALAVYVPTRAAGQVLNHWRVQVLWRVAGTLVELMDEWRALLAGATAGRAPVESTVSAGMDIARVEGFAFSILCHRDALVSSTLCLALPLRRVPFRCQASSKTRLCTALLS